MARKRSRKSSVEVKDLGAKNDPKGGGKAQKADGSLDAGIHFKYDIKGQKEG